MKQRGKAGFTLIELLVVISIIGLLASIVLASVSSARAKARDAIRLSDMRNLQTAIESYRLDNDEYPPADSDSSNGGATSDCSGAAWSTQLTAALVPEYLPTMPHDPLWDGNGISHCYRYVLDNPTPDLVIFCKITDPEYHLYFSPEQTEFNNFPAHVVGHSTECLVPLK